MTRIVVGVDGSESSLAALAWAARRAQEGDQLEVVSVWRPMVGFGSDLSPSVPDPAVLDQHTRAGLEAAVGVHIERHGEPAAPIEVIVLQGHPARTLCRHADGADLLVVGRRGGGGFTDLHIGSVSSAVAHHAPCPTVIVPDGMTS